MLVIKSAANPANNLLHMLSVVVFAISLIALYSASSIYHFVNLSEAANFRLRKLDHSMIFVLIAGTYTPILLKYLSGAEGWIFTAAIWSCALVGIVIKLCWFSAPRWLQTVLYIAMGWAILFDISIFQSMSGGAIFLLAAGGLSYTIGGVIYMIKRPNISVAFGFHELFHIFVLLGSLFHFLMIFFYVA